MTLLNTQGVIPCDWTRKWQCHSKVKVWHLRPILQQKILLMKKLRDLIYTLLPYTSHINNSQCPTALKTGRGSFRQLFNHVALTM